MNWYAISVNGDRIICPLTPERAAGLGATPAAPPADIAQRIDTLFRRLAAAAAGGSDGLLAAPAGTAAPLEASRPSLPLNATPPAPETGCHTLAVQQADELPRRVPGIVGKT